MKKSLLILLVLTTSLAMSQNGIKPTVSVVGEGIINVVPDEVTITVQVENKGEDPILLKQKNDESVNAVLTFLNNMKLDKNDISTQYVRLQKNYDYQTKTYSYYANQSIVIHLKDLSKYEELMNGLLINGINRIDGIRFATSNEEKLKLESRKKAMLDAKTKAEKYAGVLNQSIGKAISISEFSNNNQPPVVYAEATLKMSADNSGSDRQTISIGMIEIRSSINVIFELN